MTPPPVRTQRSVVTLCGTTVELEYRLDPAEHRRRQEVGLAAVTVAWPGSGTHRGRPAIPAPR